MENQVKQQETLTQSSEIVPQVYHRNYWKIMTFILLIVLFMMSILLAFLWQKSVQIEPEVSQLNSITEPLTTRSIPQITPQITESITSTDTNSTFLKSYTNTSLNFTIKYPNIENKISGQEVEKDIRIGFCAGQTDGCTLWVEKIVATTVQKEYESDIEPSSFVSTTDLKSISIGNKTYQNATIKYVDGERDQYYFQNKIDVYVISIPTQYNFTSEVINEILTSFTVTSN